MPVPLLGRAIRRRHSAVDEERGGRVVAQHICITYYDIFVDINICTQFITEYMYLPSVGGIRGGSVSFRYKMNGGINTVHVLLNRGWQHSRQHLLCKN